MIIWNEKNGIWKTKEEIPASDLVVEMIWRILSKNDLNII